MKKTALGTKKINILLNQLNFEPILNNQVRQVRWLYNNSNKCTMVYDEKLVRLMVHKLQTKIKELEFASQEQSTNEAIIAKQNELIMWLQKYCNPMDNIEAKHYIIYRKLESELQQLKNQ